MAIGFLVAYVLLSAAHVYARFSGAARVRMLTKPLLLPVLLVAYLWSGTGTVSIAVVAALVFGTLGDVLLMGTSTGRRFVVGGVCFFLGHVAYIVAFAGDIRLVGATAWTLLAAVAYLAAGVVFYRAMRPGLGSLKGLAIGYLIGLSAMSLTAALRYATLGSPSALLVLIGSLVFILSDALLMVDEFHHRLSHDGFVVMLTYCLAQGLIIGGLMLV
ncbi:MAG: lysoplasmalogenase [Propionibacteriaceae bacterium]|nr:lysoplasmalogenase [Propionibacteriaceae bacterium]